MRRTTTAVLALGSALALAGCAGGVNAQPVGSAGGAALDWRACADEKVPADVQCATLDVPVDWEKPGGRTIALTLARAPKTGDGAAEGTVVAHFGGPGTALIPALDRSLKNFAGLREHMDLVTWNPRGSSAGDHLPPDKCFPGPAFDPPDDRREYAAVAKRNRAAMRDCRDADPGVFDTMDSGTQARDMEAIRAALGSEELNFFGNSYAGAIGASYARLYPERVRTMYLDSTVDQTSPLAASDRGYEAAVEELFGRFTDWCADSAECALRGRDAEQTWQDVVATAARSPIPVEGARPGLDDDELKVLAQNLLLRPTGWPKLSEAVAQAADGDAALFAPSGRGVPALPSGSAATQCADGSGYGGYAEYARARKRTVKEFPNFGGHRAAYASMCAGWPTPVANPRRPLPSDELPPFLGAGPLFEQRAVHAVVDQVPGSAVIDYDAPAHGLYLNDGNTCVIEHADRYLIEATLPPDGTVCPPDAPR